MQNSEDVRRGITVQRNKTLVHWHVELQEVAGEMVPHASVVFSYQRAKTLMGNKQGDHTTAHALNVVRVMNLVNNFFPKESDNFSGITKLVYELQLVQKQDNFLLMSFNLPEQQDSTILENLASMIEAEKKVADESVAALSYSISAAKINKEFPGSVTASNANGQQLLSSLVAVDVASLEAQKLSIRRNYCLSVVTKAAPMLLEYQNTAAFTAFEKIETDDEKIKAFNKREGPRIRGALAALREHSTLPVDIQMVEPISNETDELDTEAKLVPIAVSAKAAPPLTRQSARAKQTVSYYESPANTKKQEAKLQGVDLIVESIYNLLYYPPVSVNYSNKPKGSETRRTNDINTLCFIIAKHLAIILATFDKLNAHKDKDEIVSKFINKVFDDWDLEISKSKQDRNLLKKNILEALEKWDNQRGLLLEGFAKESSIKPAELSMLGSPLSPGEEQFMPIGNTPMKGQAPEQQFGLLTPTAAIQPKNLFPRSAAASTPAQQPKHPFEEEEGNKQQLRKPRQGNAFETAGWIDKADRFSELHMDNNPSYSSTTSPSSRLPLPQTIGIIEGALHKASSPPRRGGPPMIFSAQEPNGKPLIAPSRPPPAPPPFTTPTPPQPPKGGGPGFGGSG